MKIYKIKNKEQIENWGKKVMGEFYVEAKDAIKEENCTREWMKIFEIGGEWYMAVHMEGGPFMPPTDKKINVQHKEVLRDVIEYIVPIVDIYDIYKDH